MQVSNVYRTVLYQHITDRTTTRSTNLTPMLAVIFFYIGLEMIYIIYGDLLEKSKRMVVEMEYKEKVVAPKENKKGFFDRENARMRSMTAE